MDKLCHMIQCRIGWMLHALDENVLTKTATWKYRRALAHCWFQCNLFCVWWRNRIAASIARYFSFHIQNHCFCISFIIYISHADTSIFSHLFHRWCCYIKTEQIVCNSRPKVLVCVYTFAIYLNFWILTVIPRAIYLMFAHIEFCLILLQLVIRTIKIHRVPMLL